MKKRLGTLILVTLMITSLLPACGISTRGTLPYGVWQNKTLGLTLNITEPIAIKITQPPIESIDPTKPIEYERKAYTGIYVIDGMETDILILFPIMQKNLMFLMRLNTLRQHMMKLISMGRIDSMINNFVTKS